MTSPKPGYRISYKLPLLPLRQLDMWAAGIGTSLADFRDRPWIVRLGPSERYSGNSQTLRHRDYAKARRHTDLWMNVMGGGEITYLGPYDAGLTEQENRERLIAAAVAAADVEDVEDELEGAE